MKCKECKKEEAVIKFVQVSIRYKDIAEEIIADNVCRKCLIKSLEKK